MAPAPMTEIDVALTPGEKEGELVVHRADCPDVRVLAALGVPVATLLGCERMPEGPRHSCLDDGAG
jgi:hypothetical protein